MESANRDLRLSVWQRQLLIGVVVALTSQVHLSLWAEGFRVSAAAILYPVLLITLLGDRRRPDTGLVTGLCVLLIRVAIDLLGGMPLSHSLLIEYPGGVFYLCYDALLCLLISDRRAVPPLRLSLSLWLCDFASNLLNLWLSSRFTMLTNLLPLAGVALVRSLIACAILWAGQGYRQLLLRSEHEQRYRRLFLMTANLKTELYFLKKDAEDIEGVGGDAADTVVGGAHDEPYPGGNRTEFADDEPVPELGVIEQHIVPLKAGGVYGVVVIGIIAHGDIGGGDHILQKTRGLELVGKNHIGIRNI